MIISMRGCVARNDLWPWPISPGLFSCDVAYFMDYLHMWHIYNPLGDEHFQVNRSKDTGKSLQFVYCLRSSQTYYFFFSQSQNVNNMRTMNQSKQFWRWSGYIGMPNFKPLLTCVLHIMRIPQIWPVTLSQKTAKTRNINRPWPGVQNLTSCGGRQDTLACQISGHSLHAFSKKCQEPPNLTCFKMRKVNRPWTKSDLFWRWSGYISMQISGHRLMRFQKMSGTPKYELFHCYKMPAK